MYYKQPCFRLLKSRKRYNSGFAGEGADADTDRKCELRVITVERCSWIENCIQNGASPRVIEEGGKKFRNEDAILRTISA